jgi:hypothetical protein
VRARADGGGRDDASESSTPRSRVSDARVLARAERADARGDVARASHHRRHRGYDVRVREKVVMRACGRARTSGARARQTTKAAKKPFSRLLAVDDDRVDA